MYIAVICDKVENLSKIKMLMGSCKTGVSFLLDITRFDEINEHRSLYFSQTSKISHTNLMLNSTETEKRIIQEKQLV